MIWSVVAVLFAIFIVVVVGGVLLPGAALFFILLGFLPHPNPLKVDGVEEASGYRISAADVGIGAILLVVACGITFAILAYYDHKVANSCRASFSEACDSATFDRETWRTLVKGIWIMDSIAAPVAAVVTWSVLQRRWSEPPTTT